MRTNASHTHVAYLKRWWALVTWLEGKKQQQQLLLMAYSKTTTDDDDGVGGLM